MNILRYLDTREIMKTRGRIVSISINFCRNVNMLDKRSSKDINKGGVGYDFLQGKEPSYRLKHRLPLDVT